MGKTLLFLGEDKRASLSEMEEDSSKPIEVGPTESDTVFVRGVAISAQYWLGEFDHKIHDLHEVAPAEVPTELNTNTVLQSWLLSAASRLQFLELSDLKVVYLVIHLN